MSGLRKQLLTVVSILVVMAVGATSDLVAAQPPTETSARPDVDALLPGADSAEFAAFGTGKKGTGPVMTVTAEERKAPAVPDASALPAQRPDHDLRKIDDSREIVDRRGRYEEAWANDDGSITTRQHSSPVHYDREGRWERIDVTLGRDAERPGWFTTTAADWSASFGPIGANGTGGVEIEVAGSTLRFAPDVDRADVQPTIDNSGKHPTVTYRDVWPGVDVRYTLSSAAVKEDIVVRSKGRASFPFRVDGDRLEADPKRPGGFRVGDDESGPLVHPPVVLAKDGTIVDSSAKPAASVTDDSRTRQGPSASSVSVAGERTSAEVDGQILTVAVDEAWLDGLTSKDLPIVIDPTVQTAPTLAASYKSDGFVDVGTMRVGNPNDSGKVWRSLVEFNFSRAVPNDRRFISQASVFLDDTPDAYGLPAVNLYWANAINYAGAAPGFGLINQGVWHADAFGSYLEVDISDRLQQWISAGQTAVMGIASPTNVTNQYSLISQAVLAYTENAIGSKPVLVNPGDGKRLVTQNAPVLHYNPINDDPDGDALQWEVRIATGSDAETGTVAASGWRSLPNNAWTVPDGVLRDGQTYYWSVWVTDHKWRGEHRAAQVRSIVVDRRLSNVDAAPNDQFGPVEANLVTGNASVQLRTPTMQTIAGPLGVSMVHNSITDRQGLEGTYWNDNSPGGDAPDRLFNAADDLVLRRIDSQINFNWGLGAPSPAVPADGFLARWEGFINVGDDPGGGADQWRLGYVKDDGIRLFINNVEVASSWTPAVAGAPVYPTAPISSAAVGTRIRIEYVEDLHNARIELWAKREGDNKQVRVPATWLSYEPRVLPVGWTFLPGDHDADYTNVRVGEAGITLYRPDGSVLEYKLSNGVYAPPPGETDIVSLNVNGTVTVQGSDGVVYLFRSDGRLERMLSTVDDKNPAAATRTFTPTGRVDLITDPVSGRALDLDYYGEGSCPAAPSWLSTQVAVPGPSGMLCRVKFPDNTQSEFFYSSSAPEGALVWMRNPGDEYTGISYVGDRISFIVDPLNTDLIATGALPWTMERTY